MTVVRVDTARRREWLRALRRFKQGVRVRAKLGALQTICERVAASRRGKSPWHRPVWTNEVWITLLYTSIRDTEFPTKLLVAFAETAEVDLLARSTQPTPEKVLEVMDEICTWTSHELRRRFGVFIEEGETS